MGLLPLTKLCQNVRIREQKMLPMWREPCQTVREAGVLWQQATSQLQHLRLLGMMSLEIRVRCVSPERIGVSRLVVLRISIVEFLASPGLSIFATALSLSAVDERNDGDRNVCNAFLL
jgi:hypothetical protein